MLVTERRGGASFVVNSFQSLLREDGLSCTAQKNKTTLKSACRDVFNRSPALIGCFVVDRRYFEEIGLLDEGMEVYGGENVELGIRVRCFLRYGTHMKPDASNTLAILVIRCRSIT